MKKVILCAIICFFYLGCSPRISISNMHVKSSALAKGYGALTIKKIKIDSSIESNINSPNFDEYSLRSNYQIDTSFCFFLTPTCLSKYYFDENLEDAVWMNCHNGYHTKKKLGNLEKEKWYIFKGIYYTDVFVYVHKSGKTSKCYFSAGNW